MFEKIRKVREAWSAGNYDEAGRLLWEVLGDLSGWSGRSAAALGATERDDCVTELEAFHRESSAGGESEGRKAGGMWLALLIQVLPQLIQILKDRKDVQPA